ncbi:MAG TPA: site-2 protease family protein [Candidatus Sulfopaludibacter sp.]|jgi:Zn-dependent protease/CBS domain-containing protein|nr:site-2 protease family protein [Candidatus Sulfopaludibacter sp.]
MAGPEKADTHQATGSLAVIRLFGVPIRLHFTFVLLLVFLLFVGVGDRQSGAMTAIYIVALFASVLLHELGHTLVARRYGIRTLEIVMYPIGGVSRPERQPAAREELWIALAGPMVNLMIAAVLLGWVAAHQGFQAFRELAQPTDANLAQRIALGNLALCVFNLLPAFPMDGGRILRSFLALHRPEEEATRIAAGAGQGLAILLGLAGLLWGNFMLVFVALFVYLGAFQEGAVARSRILTAGFAVRDAMITDLRTLEHGATIRDAGDLLLKTSQHDFPVVHGDKVIGLLKRGALVRAMMSQGPDAYVAGAMDREFVRLSPDQSLSEAITKLPAGTGCALVMDAEDRLVGMLTTEHLSEFVLLRQAGLATAGVG